MLPDRWIARVSPRLMLAAALVVSGAGVPTAHASDLPVTYAVQDKPLKQGAVAGAQLTFTLYSDAACTQQVYQATIPVENVTLISKLKLVTPKNTTKAPTTDEVRATLPGVTAGGNLYLTVTGTGVTASGPTCQAQVALDQGGLTTLSRVSITWSGYLGSGWGVMNDPSDTLSAGGSSFTATDRQAASALQSLNTNTSYFCDLQAQVQNGTVGSTESLFGGGAPAIYGVENCTPLPAGCTGGGGFCGGPCPACGASQLCSTSSDCASGHCQVPSGACWNGYPLRCVAASCFNGVKDGAETDIDCGGSAYGPSFCGIGCAAGKMCNQPCDCASGVCNGNVCQ